MRRLLVLVPGVFAGEGLATGWIETVEAREVVTVESFMTVVVTSVGKLFVQDFIRDGCIFSVPNTLTGGWRLSSLLTKLHGSYPQFSFPSVTVSLWSVLN